jgi:hypothetical protein
MVISKQTIDRLNQISSIRRHYIDQLDGMAAECCELLQAQSEREIDLARSIVDHGLPVNSVVTRMTLVKASEPNQST